MGQEIPLSYFIRSPEIPDDFIEQRGLPTFEAYRDKWGEHLNEWYSNGMIIVLENPPMTVPEKIQKLLFESDNGKKQFFKFRHVKEALSKLPNHYAYELQIEMDWVHQRFALFVQTLFGCDVRSYETAWRFAETYAQSMHLDIFSEETPENVIRGFWNVDTIPRIWWCGEHRSKFGKENAEINKIHLDAEFGGQTQRTEPVPVPHHLAFFSPKTLWFCNGQAIPHGCLYGRRMISITCIHK